MAALEADVALLRAIVTAATGRLAGGGAEPFDGHETTIKGAAWSSGYSESSIRKMIASGRIAGRKIGGRVLVDKRTLPRGAK
jgi:hypothetical protein